MHTHTNASLGRLPSRTQPHHNHHHHPATLGATFARSLSAAWEVNNRLVDPGLTCLHATPHSVTPQRPERTKRSLDTGGCGQEVPLGRNFLEVRRAQWPPTFGVVVLRKCFLFPGGPPSAAVKGYIPPLGFGLRTHYLMLDLED